MKKHLLTLIAALALIFSASGLKAQTRYLDDVFSGVLKQSNIMYDSNRSINILYGRIPGLQPIITVPLRCDIYTPDGDSITKRPVVIVAGTGSYLPAIINNQATGSKNDSSIVEVCTRFAKKGYVAVALDYRQGWNPLTTVQADAAEQLIKATYRAIQDVRNCIRFLRSNAGTYGIDTSKIVVGGQGTGGYISLALSTVNKRAEIESNPKFLRGDFTAMVNVDTLGDWNGVGGVPFFNYGGDPSVSGDAHMVFNYGGAMGDSTWIDNASLPIVSIHCITDPFAPYKTGNVVVPTTGLVVIPNASGGGAFMPYINNSFTINDKINCRNYDDAYSTRGMATNGGIKNFFTITGLNPGDGAPWEWWDRPTVQAITSVNLYGFPIPASGRAADSISMLTNSNMSAAKGRAYCDTIVGFVTPRIAVQFGYLSCNVGLNESASLNNELTVYPNPASTSLFVQLPVSINSISIVDLTGKVVYENHGRGLTGAINTSEFAPGMYFVNVTAADGRNAVKRVVIK